MRPPRGEVRTSGWPYFRRKERSSEKVEVGVGVGVEVGVEVEVEVEGMGRELSALGFAQARRSVAIEEARIGPRMRASYIVRAD